MISAAVGDIQGIYRNWIRENVNSRDSSGWAPITYATKNGRHEAVELLMGLGAWIGVVDWDGKTLPMISAAQNDFRMLKILRDGGADLDARDQAGMNTVMHAANGGYAESLEFLLSGKADIWARSFDTFSDSLLLAARNGKSARAVELILQYGASANVADKDGNSPLILAVLAGNIEMVETILKYYPKLDMFNDKGETALFIASKTGWTDMARMFLDRGADRYASNFAGEFPINVAGNSEIRMMLGKDPGPIRLRE
jgi:uncharacterized protein